MTETFIQKAIITHGDKYDYSKVKYIKAIEKVIIICKEHGEFWQTPNKHLGKSGCSKCSGVYKPTTNEFINNAILVHGDKYDYSKVEYKKAIEKVIIICKEHGEFWQTPNSHLNGSGCPFCGKTYKSDNDDFIKKAIVIHGDKYDYSKVNYTKAREHVIIICKIHGEFEQTASCHVTGDGCRKCGFEKTSQQRNSNTIEFIQKAIITHGDKYDYSKVNYTKARKNVIIICKIHGEFEQTPNKHLRPSGCNNCAINNRADNCRSNTNEFIEKAIKIHGAKYDYSKVDYIGNQNEINIICKEHGVFLQIPSVHLRGNGCQKCGGNFRYDINEFIENAIKIHGDKYDYSKGNYTNTQTKIIIICKKHGEFEQTPNSHLRLSGCPLCYNKTEGKLYEKLKIIHNTLLSQFTPYWIKPKRFDFCIPELKVIIELDGLQHFEQVLNWSPPEEQFKNDIYKQKCANDNGYSVIRLLQEDVFNNNYDWNMELCEAIENIKNKDEPKNVYLCKNDEYNQYN